MKHKLLAIVTLVLAVGVLGLGLLQPASAVKCPPGSERNKTGTTDLEVTDISTVAQCSLPQVTDTNDNLMSRITKVINVVLGVLGIVAVAVIIIGGVSFITSQGDSSKVTKAKNTVLYGIIGLVIALLAYAIVNFVLKGIFG